MKIIGIRYFLYSSLPEETQQKYKNKIYKFLWHLVFEYKGFRNWYQNLYEEGFELKSNREIIICEREAQIIGIAIIKNDLHEKKICTLKVARKYQNQGIGHHLVEMCIRQLHISKPMITLHKSKFHQFEKLLNDYSFELKQTCKHYYSYFSTELVFNGLLPEKKIE